MQIIINGVSAPKHRKIDNASITVGETEVTATNVKQLFEKLDYRIQTQGYDRERCEDKYSLIINDNKKLDFRTEAHSFNDGSGTWFKTGLSSFNSAAQKNSLILFKLKSDKLHTIPPKEMIAIDQKTANMFSLELQKTPDEKIQIKVEELILPEGVKNPFQELLKAATRQQPAHA